MDIAALAAREGAAVQVVGIVPEGPIGDRLVLRLASARVGHAALQRGPTRDLEAADLDLALRYLPDVRVIVAVALQPDVVAVAAASAAFTGAALIVTTTADVAAPDSEVVSESTIVLAAPAVDHDRAFAGVVAALAVRLGAGELVKDAWQATIGILSIDPVR